LGHAPQVAFARQLGELCRGVAFDVLRQAFV
jgi:hypothetical protein